MRSSNLSLLVCLVAFTATACKFTFDRALPPGEVRGVLEAERSGDAAREGLAQARVRAVGTPFLARTGADGKFVLRGMPSGTHTLLMTHDLDGRTVSQLRLGGIKLEPLAGATDPRNGRDLGRVLLEPAGSVSGSLTKGGQPLAGAVVAMKGVPGLFARTDAAGRYRFAFVARGSYDLALLAPGDAGLVAADLGPATVTPRTNTAMGTKVLPGDAVATVQLTGRLVAEDAIHQPDYGSLSLELVGSAKSFPIPVLPDGAWSVPVPVGVYSLHLKGEMSVAEVWMAGVAAVPGSVAPDLFVFDASRPFDYDQDGVVEGDDDSDNDGTPDKQEDPPCVFDPDGIRDTDHDGLCDSVDPDADADGVDNVRDDCPLVADPTQSDADGDGVGDACDNCPRVPNADQDPAACDGSGPRSCAVDNGGCDPHATCEEPRAGVVSCRCAKPYVGNGQTCRFPGWTTVGQGPGPRSSPLGAWDPVHKDLLVVGGSGELGVWARHVDGQTAGPWRFLDATGAAPLGGFVESAAGFWDDQGKRMLLLTAGDGSFGLGALDRSGPLPAWTDLTSQLQAGAPPANLGTSFAGWDKAKRRFVMCCDAPGTTGWSLDLGTSGPAWSSVAVTVGAGGWPGSAPGMSAVYDPENQRLVGFAGDSIEGTWALDLAKEPWGWHRLALTSSPSRRSRVAMAYDAVGRRVVAVAGRDGGEGWPLATAFALRVTGGTAWEPLPDAAEAVTSALLVSVDDGGGRVVRFGGTRQTGSSAIAEALTAGAAAWTPLGGGAALPASDVAGASMIADVAGGRVFLLGGMDPQTAGVTGTWQFSAASGWDQLVEPGPTPPVRVGAATAWDRAGKLAVVYGGEVPDSGPRSDTWLLAVSKDPASGRPTATWTPLAPSTWPGTVPRATSAMAVDDKRRQALLVDAGGRSGVFQLDLAATQPTWTPLTVAGSPPFLVPLAAVYDPVGDRLIVLGDGDGSLSVAALPLGSTGPPSWSELYQGPSTAVPTGVAAGLTPDGTGLLFTGIDRGALPRRGIWRFLFDTGALQPLCSAGGLVPADVSAPAYAATELGLLQFAGRGAPQQLFLLDATTALCP